PVAGAALLRRYGRAVGPCAGRGSRRSRGGRRFGRENLSRGPGRDGDDAMRTRLSGMNRFAVAACAALIALGGSAAWEGASAQTRAAITAGSAPQLVNLPRGTSFAVDLPTDARDVIIS